MQKEKLSRENIKQELRDATKPMRINAIIYFICAAIFALLTLTSIKTLRILPTIFGICTALLCASAIYYVVISIILVKRAQNDDFTVETDELVEVTEGYYYPHSNHNHSKPYVLRFMSGAKFKMLQNMYYPIYRYHRWSKNFNLDCKGMYNYAHIGDIYYTVSIINPKRPDVVFNSRLFDLIE